MRGGIMFRLYPALTCEAKLFRALRGFLKVLMRTTCLQVRVQAASLLVLLLTSAAWAGLPHKEPDKEKDKPETLPVVRWAEDKPGCTFTRGEDGKYRYGMTTDDLVITLAVDSQELEKVKFRIGHLFGLMLTVRYRGTAAADVRTGNLRLQFIRHHGVAHSSLDPEELPALLQTDADELSRQTEREVKKHPEKKKDEEARLQTYQKELAELLEFISSRSLRPTKLDPGNPEVSGWVFFSTKSPWIGEWKKPEDFVFRMRLENRVFAFPFRLPPKEGELLLRRRPEN
jgi:hypothetical protein